jgi:hypothetical protein
MHSGLDPEFLALSDGIIIPAEHYLPAPIRDADGVLNPLSWDNAAAELRPSHTTSPSRLTKSTFSLMKRAKSHLNKAIKEDRIPCSTQFSLIPAAKVEGDDFILPSVQQFGCSPSRLLNNDYSLSVTTPSMPPGATRIRSAGFHLHQEMTDPTASQAAVGVLDGILGLSDVIANDKQGWTEASRMRRLDLGYGRAGEHRVRLVATGATVLEYRAMSPWPLGSKKSMLWSIEIMRAVCAMSNSTLMKLLGQLPSRSEITSTINNADTELAKPLLRAFHKVWRGGKYAD